MSNYTPTTLRNSANFYGVIQPNDDPWLNNHLAAWEADLAKLEAMERVIRRFAFLTEAEWDTEMCHSCEGNGNRYADGKTHYPSEHAPTVSCGTCGGSGQIRGEEIKSQVRAMFAEIDPNLIAAAQQEGR